MPDCEVGSIKRVEKSKKIVRAKTVVLVVFYSIIYSIGFELFISSSGLLATGFAGISQIIVQFSKIIGWEISYGVVYYLINIPGLILSYRKLGKPFTFYTLLSISVVSGATMFFEHSISSLIISDDIILKCIFGGIIMGYGVGGLLKIGTSSGGIDIIGLYFVRAKNVAFDKLNLIMNAVIVGIAMMLFGVEIGLYTLLSLYVRNLTMARVFSNNNILTVLIVGPDLTEVNRYINEDLGRGTTVMEARGGYTKNPKEVIMATINNYEYQMLLNDLGHTDEKFFINVLDTKAVEGNYRPKLDKISEL